MRGRMPAHLVRRGEFYYFRRALPVGQVTCISAAVPRILAASGFVPGHVHLRPVSQPDRITNP